MPLRPTPTPKTPIELDFVKTRSVHSNYLIVQNKRFKKEIKRLRKALIKLAKVSIEAAETDNTLRVKKL